MHEALRDLVLRSLVALLLLPVRQLETIAEMSSCTTIPRVDISSLEMAIRVRDLNLTYGGCLQAKAEVMKNLSMEVPRGYIYGLLGPSGCGKTSLMRCILGTLHANSGDISVFGTKPGTSKSKVPGPGVGYMPQDITLYTDLSILETLSYFARLSGMSRKDIAGRVEFLVTFLNMPDRNRMIGKLSGGQMRRASLAVALIHKPPLLILDEPTVGVDPLLRKSIWDHLSELSKKDRLTVLITTHYIEEAKDANLVGFMRDCKILDQDTPPNLLLRYGLGSLEQVFLHLCTNADAQKAQNQKQDSAVKVPEPKLKEVVAIKSTPQESQITPFKSCDSVDKDGKKVGLKEDGEKPTVTTNPPRLQVSGFSDISNEPTLKSSVKSSAKSDRKTLNPDDISHNPPFYQCSTMICKNLRSLIRSPGYLLFQCLLPLIEAVLFCSALGRDLTDVPVAVYDGDNSTYSTAIVKQLNRKILKPTMYATEVDAIESVRNGTESTAMVIYPNFAICLYARMASSDNDTQVLRNSTIQLFPDLSNQLMVQFVVRELLTAFQNVTKRTLHELLPEKEEMAEFPVNMSTPIYGLKDQPFIDYMAPGSILSIAFFAAISLTTMNLVIERINGLLERTNVVGVSILAILSSHMLAYSTVLIIQVVLLLGVVLWWFAIPFAGSLALLALLTILQSICGMMMGLFISAVSDTENTATMLAIGLFYPALLLSGTMWPLNAMKSWLHKFSLILPQTVPIESMRIMMIRGWGMSHWEVASGFVVTIIWIIAFLLVSIMAIKFKQF